MSFVSYLIRYVMSDHSARTQSVLMPTPHLPIPVLGKDSASAVRYTAPIQPL